MPVMMSFAIHSKIALSGLVQEELIKYGRSGELLPVRFIKLGQIRSELPITRIGRDRQNVEEIPKISRDGKWSR